MKRRDFLCLAVMGAIILSATAVAQDEPVVLEVSGDVEAARSFTLSQLRALGVTTIETSTAWTDGTRRFEGVLARSVMAAIGPVSSEFVTAQALNDYQADIPLSDFADYDVIFAWSMDGEMLSRRDKGPLWIVYPRDSRAHLSEERYEHRWVWQLHRLTLP